MPFNAHRRHGAVGLAASLSSAMARRANGETSMADRFLLPLLVTTALLIAACGAVAPAVAPAPATRAFTDSVGRSVQIPATPQRIVALNDSNGGVQVLSLGVKLVGLTTRNGESPLAKRYDLSGVEAVGDYNSPNLEKIAALKPDLIVGYAFRGQPAQKETSLVQRLEEIAPTVFMDTGGKVDAVMTGFATLLGVEARLDEQRAAYRARIATMKEKIGPDIDNITVSVIQMQDDGRINTFGKGWFAFGEVLQDIGFTSFPANQATGVAVETCCLPSVSLEELPEFDGDIILYYKTRPTNDYTTQPLFQQLKAVKAGQILEWDSRWWGNTYDTLTIVLDDLERFFSQKKIDPNVYTP
jgi:iron complex transport system substrate-binding protein